VNNQTKQRTIRLFWSVLASVFVALILMLVQLPQDVFYFWPDWIALLVIFWALSEPDQFGPWVAFIIGTLLEVLFVRKFGVLGLGLATLAFIVNSANQQLRILSLWQKTMLIGVFVGLFKVLTGWLYGLVADFTITTDYWYSIIGGMLVWPFVYILLQELRRLARLK